MRELRRIGRRVNRAGRAGRADAAGPAALTARELEIARLVAGGLTNRAVAETLFLSEKTIESHLAGAFVKLGVRIAPGARRRARRLSRVYQGRRRRVNRRHAFRTQHLAAPADARSGTARRGGARRAARLLRQGALREYGAEPAGAPVLLVPGFLAGDRSLQPLAQRLADAGHRPCPAGIHRNIDCSETATERLSDRLEAIVAGHGRAIPVVGHSRGGMLAQVLARRRPGPRVGHRDDRRAAARAARAAPGSAGVGALAGRRRKRGLRGVIRYSCAFGRLLRGVPRGPRRSRRRGSAPSGRVFPARRDRRLAGVPRPGGHHVEVASTHCGMAADHVTGHVVASFLATV